MTDYAYCTLVTKESYIQGAKNLYTSWQANKCKNDFFIIVTDNLQDKLQLFDNIPIKLVPYKKFKVYDFKKLYNAVNYCDTINKYYIWSFIEYKRILFLDADMILLNNIDDIFLVEPTKACFYFDEPTETKGVGIDGSKFIITPNLDTFNKLIATETTLDIINDEEGIARLLFNSKDFYNLFTHTKYKFISKYFLHIFSKQKYWEIFSSNLDWKCIIEYLVDLSEDSKLNVGSKVGQICNLILQYNLKQELLK